MGTVTHLNERTKPLPTAISTEAEALHAARALRDKIRETGRFERRYLAQSGLLAIAIPSEFCGADLANSVIAEVVESLASASPAAAHALIYHHAAMEAIRHGASPAQQSQWFSRVLQGELFHLMLAPHQTGLKLEESHVKLQSPLIAAEETHSPADWLVVACMGEQNSSESGPKTLAVLANHDHENPLNHAGQNSEIETIITYSATAQFMVESVLWFLRGAALLGKSRQTSVKTQRSAQNLLDEESLAALIELAGLALDSAQVQPEPPHIKAATRATKLVAAAASRLEFGPDAPGIDQHLKAFL